MTGITENLPSGLNIKVRKLERRVNGGVTVSRLKIAKCLVI